MTRQVIPVAQDDLPAIVTHLHLRAPLGWPVPALPAGHRIDLARSLSVTAYLEMFRMVGEHWMWQGRLRQSEDMLSRYLAHPETRIFVLSDDDGLLGFAEINLNADPCDLAYFGLTKRAIGRGLGRCLIGHALSHAFDQTPLVHVQTCTLDHPAALAFYRKCGFQPIAREIEIMPDPRHSGLIDRNAAPQIPMLGEGIGQC